MAFMYATLAMIYTINMIQMTIVTIMNVMTMMIVWGNEYGTGYTYS